MNIVMGAFSTWSALHSVRTRELPPPPPIPVQSLPDCVAHIARSTPMLPAMQPKYGSEHYIHHKSERFVHLDRPSVCLPLHPLQLCSAVASKMMLPPPPLPPALPLSSRHGFTMGARVRCARARTAST